MAAILIASGAVQAWGQSSAASASTSPATGTATKKPAKQESLQEMARGSESSSFATGGSDQHVNTFRNAPKHFLLDEKAMWTSPAHIRLPDATWLVPLGGFAAGLFATDTDVSRNLNSDPNTLSHYRTFSNYGLGAMVGAAGGAYFLGLATHNKHEQETGFLSGEAAVDSVIAAEALKYMMGRERPLFDNARGRFWQGGDSFPSVHSTAAWSIAAVVAHEYPGLLPNLAAYGLATAISASRVTSKEHFPSDALVGSAIGWLVGQYVYRDHHDPDVPGGGWSPLGVRPDRPGHWQAKYMGSPYVPLDSWIYPALLRLAALGYIKSDFEGMRPWTRMECARLVEEADENIGDQPTAGREASSLDSELQEEFSREIALLGGGNNKVAQLESVYTRVTGISGEPLADGYDFGQTIVNDDGRPYAGGFNNTSGASGWFSDGPFVGYVQAEYQHAPSSPALPNSALQAIAQEEVISSIPPSVLQASISQFDMPVGYVGMQFDNWQITFGKQEQWWGPDEAGAMMFSTNAEPIEMLQINRVSPFRLPSVLGLLGPIRTQFVLGRIDGYHWLFGESTGLVGSWTQTLADQPFLVGEKLSIRPSRNLEMGFSATRLFAGTGVPFTAHKLLQAIFSTGNGLPGSSSDPGDARGGFDFTYRIPGARNWLTWYGDGFTDDEPSPLAGAFDKSAFDSGIYVSHFPGLSKLDFRAEGLFTDNPNSNPVLQHGFFYWNDRYRSGYTNDGNLLASWIGREGQGAEAWSTYWFTSKNTLQFSFRHQKVSQQLVPFGGTLTDGGVNASLWIGSQLQISPALQYEEWNFPVLAAGRQTDVTASVQVTYWPRFGHRQNDTSTDAQGSNVEQSLINKHINE